jgi:hypothetical protein
MEECSFRVFLLPSPAIACRLARGGAPGRIAFKKYLILEK